MSLTAAGIDYCVISALGGLRGKAAGASMNMGWRNTSFRNYADYMQTPAFVAGLEELMSLAKESVTVIMCAEAVPWR